ncbi:MAG: SDR family NAD(P)-dependent oxidoreductase [Pseudomonadota bacterium]
MGDDVAENEGKVVVIIGVGNTRGVGAALARRFGREGLHCVLAGRTTEKLAAIVTEVEAAGGSAEAVATDTTVEADVGKLFDVAESRGPLASVLYNAGNNAIIPFLDLTPEQFEAFWRVCCFGGFLVSQRAVPTLATQGYGSLLFTGASASLRGKAQFGHFASAKAAVRNMAQAIAREYGPKGIHVGHVVIDGIIDGDMVRSRFPQFIDQMGPSGLLNPDHIADAFWMLHAQPPSTWTFELDVRPYRETW